MVSKTNTKKSNWIFWLSIAIIFCSFVYLTKSVIMPFVAGMLIGYLFDPLVIKMSKFKINRTLAAILILTTTAIIFIPIFILVINIANEQITKFISSLPKLVASFAIKSEPILIKLSGISPSFAPENIKEYISENSANGIKIIGKISAKVLSKSFAFINILSLLVITPVVAFYMLRDWRVFIKKINELLPVKSKNEIRTIAKNIDRAIAGFIRGQLSVCVILGSFYSIGLYAVGLQLGVVVGFVAGIISFIPYVGTITGFVTAMIIAIIQFDTVGPIIAVVVVFLIGQMLEGLYLTPKLVGDSVGLHPVWVMFSLLAGGVILGFLGIMIAVPVAAIINVIIKHFINKYKNSAIYKE